MKTLERKAIDTMLKPRSIAVVGASARDGSLGNTVMKKLLGFEYTGKIYPINPKAPDIMGIKAYTSVLEVPGEIDTAVLCVPGQFVIDVVKELNQKGVKSCIIISAGFKEIGPEGVQREEELKNLVKASGMRVVGPNCFGIINGTGEISLDCTFARNFASRGYIGFISQSGAVGAAINEDLRRTTMGLSLFITLGNRIDIDENELLEYLAEDENTHIIFMYLENFSDPLRFLEIARKITPHKPIIALKAGKSSQGAAAAASHTGQIAQSDNMVSALMEKAGVIRVDSVAEMIMAAKALYSGVIPAKDDLAVITNAGGFGVLAIDKAEEISLKLAEFSPETTKFLKENLPEEASCNNPIDVLGTGTHEHYGIALEGVLSDPKVGGVIYNFGPPVMQKADPIAQIAVDTARKHPDKPVLSIYMNRHRIMEPLSREKDVYVSQFDYPEEAVWAYSKLLQYKRIKNRNLGEVPSLKADRAKVEAILTQAKNEGRNRLDFDEGEAVLNAYGIPMVKSVVIMPGDNIEQKTSSLRFPVAIKPRWGGVTHKTEMKAVRLGLRNSKEIETSVTEISESISHNMGSKYDKGFVVQEMATGKREIILGSARQDSGICLLLFGLGGIFVEVLKDVAFAIPPITPAEAENMMHKIKGYPILEGVRGEKGINLPDIKDILVKLSLLVSDFPQIKEMDINPFIASDAAGESKAVDVRIII